MTSARAPVDTERLRLIPATREHLDADLSGREALGCALFASVPASWPPGEFDADAIRFFISRYDEMGDAALGWFCWYALERNAESQPDRLIAAAGFFGPPQDGVTEIGYSVIPEAQGKGYATEFVQGLIDIARRSGSVNTLLAHTYESNAASVAVLRKAGFVQVECEDAEKIRFRRELRE